MKPHYKIYNFKKFYLSLKASMAEFDFFPRFAIHWEYYYKDIIFSWMFFTVDFNLKWTKKQEEEYNGD